MFRNYNFVFDLSLEPSLIIKFCELTNGGILKEKSIRHKFPSLAKYGKAEADDYKSEALKISGQIEPHFDQS